MPLHIQQKEKLCFDCVRPKQIHLEATKHQTKDVFDQIVLQGDLNTFDHGFHFLLP